MFSESTYMVGSDYENEQVDVKNRRTFNLRVSYTMDLTEKLDHALQFVVKKIGFNPAQETTFSRDADNDLTLIDSDGNILMVSLQLLEGACLENIIFHTDDCLRDYHKYLMSGVEFISRPEYHATGLQVNFIDHEDNCYTLLEERIYTEP